MKKVHAVLFAGTVLAALAGAAPAYATVAACSVSQGTIFNPKTGVTQSAFILNCPTGPTGTNSLSTPYAIGGVQAFTSAITPPAQQFFEFSTPLSALSISFISQDAITYNGSLDLYNASDALVKAASITAGSGELDVTGLNIGSNYILGIGYGTDVDPNYRVTFSAAVNGPTANVPEPVTLSLFGAGLAGAAAIRRRKAKKA